MDKKTQFETQIHMQRMLPIIGWVNTTIMEIHNSRSESACREGEDTGPPGNRSVVKGFLHSWSLHGDTRSAWIYTNQ